MKYISLLLFLVAMAWTWNLATKNDNVPLEDHNTIEQQLSSYIEQMVKKNRPAAEIQFEEIFPEVIKPNSVFHYHVRYNITEKSGTDTSVEKSEAIAVLKRQPETNDYLWESVKLDMASVEFQVGSTISKKDLGEDPQATEEKNPAVEPTVQPPSEKSH